MTLRLQEITREWNEFRKQELGGEEEEGRKDALALEYRSAIGGDAGYLIGLRVGC